MHRHISQTILALTRFGYIASAAALVVTCLIASQDTLAQDFGGGGGIDDLTQLQQQNTPTGNAGGIGGGGGGIGGGNGLGTFGSEEVDLLSGIGIDDVRNQGFVGATGTRIQELGFVGPPGKLPPRLWPMAPPSAVVSMTVPAAEEETSRAAVNKTDLAAWDRPKDFK